MIVEVSDSLRQALNANSVEPVRLIDPQTHAEYVVLRKEVYEQLEQLVGLDPKVSYPLVDETFRKGWDDPKMAEYDNYEAFKRS